MSDMFRFWLREGVDEPPVWSPYDLERGFVVLGLAVAAAVPPGGGRDVGTFWYREDGSLEIDWREDSPNIFRITDE